MPDLPPPPHSAPPSFFPYVFLIPRKPDHRPVVVREAEPQVVAGARVGTRREYEQVRLAHAHGHVRDGALKGEGDTGGGAWLHEVGGAEGVGRVAQRRDTRGAQAATAGRRGERLTPGDLSQSLPLSVPLPAETPKALAQGSPLFSPNPALNFTCCSLTCEKAISLGAEAALSFFGNRPD